MTLLELLLVVVLLLCFAVLGLWFSTSINSYQQLNEGVPQLVSLLRYSKAMAQQTGRVVVVQFPHAAVGDEAEASTTITNEATVVVELPAAAMMAAEVNASIKVVQLSNEASAISFYPDGSFDTASIVIYSLNDEDQRRAIIQLNGLNGTINQQPHDP